MELVDERIESPSGFARLFKFGSQMRANVDGVKSDRSNRAHLYVLHPASVFIDLIVLLKILLSPYIPVELYFVSCKVSQVQQLFSRLNKFINQHFMLVDASPAVVTPSLSIFLEIW